MTEAITYKTPDHQKIFDHVVKNLFDQGGPAILGTGSSCAYRDTTRNRRCAFGWLIPDDEYNPKCENNSLDRLGRLKIGPLMDMEDDRSVHLTVPEENVGFIRQLQYAHDFSCAILPDERGIGWNVAKIKEELEKIVNDFSLSPAVYRQTFALLTC